jgi:hypothetical protein
VIVNLTAAMQTLTTALTTVGLKMLGAIVPEQHYSVRGVEKFRLAKPA